MAVESSLTKKLPCAFCGDYTELVRACLTPQCEACLIDRELDPKLPCLPECRFSHGSEGGRKNISTVTSTRQVQLLQILAEVFSGRVQTVISQVQVSLDQVRANLELAQLYQRIGLTAVATAKEEELSKDQLEFQLQQCREAVFNLFKVITTATESDQLYCQIDRVETFLSHYVVIPVTPLVLPHQVVPEAADIINLAIFNHRRPDGRAEQPQTNPMYPLNLLPGVEDDIIMLKNFINSSPCQGRLYYNLTRQESFQVTSHAMETPPKWLPHYYADFTADDFVAFSETGVWLYYDKELIHRILINGLIPPGQRDPGFYQLIPTPRPWLLTSRGKKMIMLTVTDNGAVYSAWNLTDVAEQKQTWINLSSYRLHATYGFYSLAFTTASVNDTTVILAESYQNQIIVIVLDFTTGQVCHQSRFATVSFTVTDIDYLAVIDDCIHVVARHETQYIDYHIYSLTGQLLVKRDDLPHWNDKPGIPPLAVVKTKQARIKICY